MTKLEKEYEEMIQRMNQKEAIIEEFIKTLSIEAKILKTIIEVSDQEYYNLMHDENDNFSFIIGRILWNGTLKNEDKVKEFYPDAYKEARAKIEKYTANW